jgi:putative exosortase-associated protein (TIGR04073 family)
MPSRSFLAMVILFTTLSIAGTRGNASTDEALEYSAPEKLKRGLANLVTFPFEVMRLIDEGIKEKNGLYAWTISPFPGAYHATKRALAGVVDVLTFPVEFPKAYRAPLVEPGYIWRRPLPEEPDSVQTN